MELSYDWRSFQSVFFRKRKVAPHPDHAGPIYLVSNHERIIASLADTEDLSEWIGRPVSELKEKLSHREVIAFDRDKVDQWVSGCLSLPHFYDQIEYLRSEAIKKAPKTELPFQANFLLKATQSWWNKVLPSAYGIYIRIESKPEKSLIVLIRRGRLESFHVPDFGSMMAERKKDPSAVVKYLSEKYMVPVQGIFASAEEWDKWNDSGNPWPQIALAVKGKQGKAKLVPFSWGMATLVGARAFLGI